MICPRCGENYDGVCECGYAKIKPGTLMRVALVVLFIGWVLLLLLADGCSRCTFQQKPSKCCPAPVVYKPEPLPEPPMVVPPYKRTYRGDIIVRNRKIIYRDKLGRESELD